MQISCEKCSTAYELDARLIPPAGAPVQCTRCGHVFNVLPDGTVARRASTQMFGAVPKPATSEQPPQQSTQVFGKPGTSEQPPQQSTQVFGKPVTPPGGSTKIFGERIPAVEEPMREPTLTFGKLPPMATQRDPASAFAGVPAMEGMEPEPMRESTLAFGKLPSMPGVPPVGSNPRATQVFGAVAAKPVEAPRATQVFGAVRAPSGLAPELPPESPRERTQVFGNAPQPAPAAPPPARPAAAPPQSSTQIFGAAEVAAAVAKATRPSQPAMPAVQPQPGRTTQLFGAAPAQPPAGAPLESSAPKASSTQIFGFNEIQAKLAQASAAAAAASAAATPSEADEQTQPGRFLDKGPRTAPEVRLPDEPAPAPGHPLSMEEIAPDRAVESGFDDDLQIDMTEPAPVMRGQPSGAQQVAPRSFGASAPLRTGEQSRVTEPDLPRRATGDHVPVNLPPESLPPLELGLNKPKGRPIPAAEDEELLRVEAGLRQRNFGLVAVLLLVAIGAATFIGYKIVAARRAAVPQDVLVSLDGAMSLLRKDDAGSQKKALDQMQDVSRRFPDLLEAKANLVLALSIRLDDTRLAIKRIELESEILGRRMAKLDEERSSSDWENRINAMTDQRQELRKLLQPLQQQATELDAALMQAFTALPQQPGDEPLAPRDETALWRAQAVYYGVRGSDEALVIAEKYRGKNLRDGWDAIAYAEYALNARVPPDTLGQAYGALDGVIAEDSSFLRAYVLSARVSLLQKRYDLASNTLEATMALNPAHELAPKLLSWARQAERAAAGQ